MIGGVRWIVVAASCMLALGCGGSDKNKDASGSNADAGSKGGNSGSTGSGSGGSTAAGTGGTSAGTGGQMGGVVVMNVHCGPKVCAGAAPSEGMMQIGMGAGFSLAETCCADESAGTCGTVAASDMTCNAPPEVDPDCPKTMGMGGCCAGGTECGFDGSLFGQGCIALSGLPIPPAFRMQFGIPDPTDCDGKPLMSDAGAGDQDGGM